MPREWLISAIKSISAMTFYLPTPWTSSSINSRKLAPAFCSARSIIAGPIKRSSTFTRTCPNICPVSWTPACSSAMHRRSINCWRNRWRTRTTINCTIQKYFWTRICGPSWTWNWIINRKFSKISMERQVMAYLDRAPWFGSFYWFLIFNCFRQSSRWL